MSDTKTEVEVKETTIQKKKSKSVFPAVEEETAPSEIKVSEKVEEKQSEKKIFYCVKPSRAYLYKLGEYSICHQDKDGKWITDFKSMKRPDAYLKANSLNHEQGIEEQTKELLYSSD